MSNEHDPMSRLEEGEKHFTLAARDPTAPAFVRLWAVVRENAPNAHDRAYALIDAIIKARRMRGSNPQKDRQHAASARIIADEMQQWRLKYMQGAPEDGRVDAHEEPAREYPERTIEEIKAARPPAEPDEGS